MGFGAFALDVGSHEKVFCVKMVCARAIHNHTHAINRTANYIAHLSRTLFLLCASSD
jgi:hypothetical protein